MKAEQVEALLTAAAEGVDTEVLTASESDGTYDFSVPDATYHGLTDAELRDAARRHSEAVTEWYFWERVAPDAPDRRAFLRWVEGADDLSLSDRRERLADGVARDWGQLRIRARTVEVGRRAYEVRHVDDAGERVEDLAVHTDPLDARELAKHDDRGRYRPLSTAPTLQRGWAFVDLEPAAVVRAVDTFYPATIANWHRERAGDLDVSHWRETAGRQTGIYGVVDTWDRGEGHEHVEWVAEACCADSQCLKRREWEYDEETDLDVHGGDGTFPCREPCSLVISAARRWARIEGEEARTYEFELTPSEKEQVEEIVDAVADGRADDVREADFSDGANRWRARYLRAKRMSDGTLSGVPTDRDEDGGGD
ncbi:MULTISPECIES: DR2241 family protein [Salinibaculum]|uniref:DR2241 family protein n=1 Tax=Salinibaculum TaxID=2732368 RepID=UPI0030CD0F2E